ncbi:MAG: aminopeptidase P N-terminal domain-containing protein [Armatimonadetes bacterium]|nr:aminopeptidase P N-terminal domain-containing protein [Armatimonadota bacterium]
MTRDPRQLPYQADFPPEEFAARRAKLFDAVGPSALALLQGAGPVERSEAFRQTNEFYYLCGVEAPGAYLLLDGRSRTTSLFLPRRDERQEASEGPSLSSDRVEEVRRLTGVDFVGPVEELASCLEGAGKLYTPHQPAEGRSSYRDELLYATRKVAEDPWGSAPSREARFIERLKGRFPGLLIRDLSPVLDGLRLVKSPREVDLMRRAGRMTALAVCEAMRCTRPGLKEYELGALARCIFGLHGSQGDGYRAIIAAGTENIGRMHYWRCDGTLSEGDLILMDYAPDTRYYTSDIGRMWPVSGRYSPVQRELYGFIVGYYQALLKRIRPGVLPDQVMDEAAEEMAGVVEATRFSKPIYEAAARRALAFRGHLSHPVGMAVHDVGNYRDRPLEPGLVFSVDPQMWVPEERLYIRVEDTGAVTEGGFEVFTSMAPLELDEVESLMGEDGVLDRIPRLPD